MLPWVSDALLHWHPLLLSQILFVNLMSPTHSLPDCFTEGKSSHPSPPRRQKGSYNIDDSHKNVDLPRQSSSHMPLHLPLFGIPFFFPPPRVPHSSAQKSCPLPAPAPGTDFQYLSSIYLEKNSFRKDHSSLKERTRMRKMDHCRLFQALIFSFENNCGDRCVRLWRGTLLLWKKMLQR